jgi:hypothetical protein
MISQQTVIVSEEITSPELVLVSPPEIAAQAREALPNYEFEYETSDVDSRAAALPEVAAQAQEEAAEQSEPKPDRTVAEPLPTYELERKWPWYELEPKPLDKPPEQRPTIRAFTYVSLAALLSLISLVLLILYNR